ncbi:lysyl oxidase family protein [Mucisphaera calidilacus]|uniref:Lysyl oxidase n=1 Tax=Mucisphaera calidilacus TaxID=2527982 RepID=A0A518BZ29_9BACT|nr:lysyl oxidase family protein [Mucisphaera calidilacus]QDU72227.1 Lysyl oxidase [Mucisphaera calidilacus]
MRVWMSVVMSLMVVSSASAGALLPDLTAVSSRVRGFMYDGSFDLDVVPGRVIFRFSTAIPNIGDGPFEVYEETDEQSTQTVYQHIYQEDGSYERVVMGVFEDAHPHFGHLYLVGLARYSLLEAVPDGDAYRVGDVVATKLKTSQALVDSTFWDLSLPNASPKAVYQDYRAPILGVSVGWLDLYFNGIPEQWIDVTGVPSGTYWLEVEVDPSDYVRETDETNNVHRVLVSLDIPEVPEPSSGVVLGLALLTRCRRRILP